MEIRNEELTGVHDVINYDLDINVYKVNVSKNIRRHANKFSDRTILLDTCAGKSIFKNADLFSNIVHSNKPILVEGINSRSQPLFINSEGDTKLGRVYYDERAVGNVLSFGECRETCHSITYGYYNDTFRLQVNNLDNVYIFTRHPVHNIYFCDIDMKETDVLVTTVSDKIKLYSKREVAQAQEARDLQIKLGLASDQSLLKMISRGKIHGTDVVQQDVRRALDIWGQCIGNLKGKTTMTKSPIEEQSDPIEEPTGVLRDQIWYIDLLFINGDPYLLSYFDPLEYPIVSKLENKTEWTLLRELKAHLVTIIRRGFKITSMRVDGESGIDTKWAKGKFPEVPEIDVTAKHVKRSKVERKIRQIKERIRGIINTLPFKLPPQLEVYLIQYVVSRIVLIPTRNSGEYVSPREKLFGRSIIVQKELKHAFGDYVHAHDNETDNTMKPRTEAAIALLPTGNRDGSWYYYLLSTKEVVTRLKATVLPMPDIVIKYLNDIHDKSVKVKKKSRGSPEFLFERGIHRVLVDCNEDLNYDDDEDSNDNERIIQPQAIIHPAEDEVEEEQIYNRYVQRAVEQNDDEVEVEDESPEDLRVRRADNILWNHLLNDDNDIQQQRNENSRQEQPSSESSHQVMQNLEETPLRRSVRLAEKADCRNVYTRREYGLNMTVNQGIQKLGYDAILAIVREIMQIVDREVFEGVEYSKLTLEEMKKIITSFCFLKEKYNSEGVYEKLKARLVGGGNMMNREIYDKGASPTVATTSVFMIAAIAAYENRAVAKIDFPGAFLYSEMPATGKHSVLMKLDKFLTSILVRVDPTYQRFVKPDGTCIVKLKRALYGCIESARMWYDKLSTDLKKLNYVVNKQDICVFNRKEKDDSQSTICIFVDDLLVTAKSEDIIDSLIEELSLIYGKFGKLDIHRGRKLSYIGMTFDFEQKGKCIVSMDGYINELLEECKHIEGLASTPAKSDLFRIDETSEPLDEKGKNDFHSLVAKVLYPAKRVRDDLLTATSFLSRRVQRPTVQDREKLHRMIRYIRATKNLYKVLQVGEELEVKGYIDASYAVHNDCKGQSGCVITVGRAGSIYSKSSVQKLNTKSSTECELVATADHSGQVIYVRNFMIEQGYKIKPAKIYKDNQSELALIKNGQSNSARTRHIAVRFFFLKDRVDKNEIVLEYLRTEDMLADFFTKPLQGKLFRTMRAKILNFEE